MGKKHWKALKEDHYDLVVLDVMMEDMDGYTILQKLRAAEDMTPVLMLSGKQEEMNQILGLGMGADDYLTKPFLYGSDPEGKGLDPEKQYLQPEP